MKLPLRTDSAKILDFDIENMPLTYYVKDYPTAFVTAIAWAFDSKKIEVRVVEDIRDQTFYEAMLLDFWSAYAEADMVTGHYIRKHDLPIINGQMIEAGLGGLEEKNTSDTKMDLVRFSAIPKTQEFLEATLRTKMQKVNMTQADWRRANRFFPDGVAKTRKRVTTDVKGHMQLRQKLIEEELLRVPKMWRP